jgi:two-component system, sensor histidine kinase YesM
VQKLAEKLDQWTSQFKLQTKLLVTFYMISFVPLLATAAFFYFASTKSLEEEVGASLIQTTRQVDERLSSNVEEMAHLTKFIYYDQNTQSFLHWKDPADQSIIASLQELRSFLEYIVAHRPHLNSVYLVNDFGRSIFGNKDIVKMNYDFPSDSWYKEVIKDTDFRLMPAHPQNYGNGEPVVTYGGRLFQVSDLEESGTLLMDFDPEYFSTITESIRVGKTGEVFMLTPDGNAVIKNDKEHLGYYDHLMELNTLEKESGYLLTRIEGVQTLVGFSTSKSTGWKIIGVVPFAEVSGKIKTIRNGVLIFSILATLFILLVSKYLSHAITRPLLQLQDYMGRVETGDFSPRVPLERKDEFGTLTRKFNHMLERLEILKDKVYMSELRETKLQLLNRESELKALQMQINPHFLYNTLNTMKCVGEVYEVKEVAEMSEGLAEMFRYSIDNEKYKTLQDELEHVKAYLQIIQVRYPERVCCHFDISQSVSLVPVLKLILQPLVENALEHGLIPKGDKGNIWINAFQEKNQLVVKVSDDGVGIEEQRLIEIKQKLAERLTGISNSTLLSGHIGLDNVHQRLYLNYGEEGFLKVDSERENGTTVEIRLPIEEVGKGKQHV